MKDYGRPLEFGVFPVPEAERIDDIRAQVAAAERAGLDLVGIQDHPYQRRYLDTLALIASLAASSSRIRFFTDVVSLPLRPAPVLAKTAASIDILSGGRFELGLGAGAFWDAIEAYGGERRSPGDAIRALEETIDVCRLLWSDEKTARYDGVHHSLAGAKPGPQPAHSIEIWLGVFGPKALGLLGRKADGWLPSLPGMPVEELNPRHEAIDAAAVAAGRDPAAIRRLANVNGVITDGESGGFLRGPEDQWIDELTSLALNHGIDTFILWSEGEPVRQAEIFAEIAVTVRQIVELERS